MRGCARAPAAGGAAGRGPRSHHEPDRAAALLDRLHGVLHLKQAALRAPCGHVRVILRDRGGAGASRHTVGWRLRGSPRSPAPGCTHTDRSAPGCGTWLCTPIPRRGEAIWLHRALGACERRSAAVNGGSLQSGDCPAPMKEALPGSRPQLRSPATPPHAAVDRLSGRRVGAQPAQLPHTAGGSRDLPLGVPWKGAVELRAHLTLLPPVPPSAPRASDRTSHAGRQSRASQRPRATHTTTTMD